MLKGKVKKTLALDLRMLESSGIGVYLQQLVPRIIGQCPELHFLLLGDPVLFSKYPWTQAPRVERLAWTAPLYSMREQFLLPLLLAKKRPDLLWLPHYNFPLAWPKKMAVTVHDLNHLALARLLPGRRHRLYARFMFRMLVRRARRIFTVSAFSAGELQRLLSAPPERISMIHNGLDESWFEPVSGPAPHERPYLLFVGNLKPHKNLAVVLRAMLQLGADWPYDLLVVGRSEGFITADREGPGLARFLADRVHFRGRLEHDQLRLCYRHARALVFPSIYEGFGFPPLEAMASGCPVLAAESSSIPEVCGRAALYFDPSDSSDLAAALERICGDESLRATLQAEGRARSALFSWDRAAEAYADELKKELEIPR